MTGLEWVSALVRLNGYSSTEARHAALGALEAVDLVPAADKKIGAYSKGMRQRVKLAQALVHDPDLLILDEPLTGMDPLMRRRTIRIIREWARDGRSVLVSSHILHEVEAMTSNVLLINNGRILAEGDVHDIRALIDHHPHTVHIRAERPRELARECLSYAYVRSLRFEGDALVVETDAPGHVLHAGHQPRRRRDLRPHRRGHLAGRQSRRGVWVPGQVTGIGNRDRDRGSGPGSHRGCRRSAGTRCAASQGQRSRSSVASSRDQLRDSIARTRSRSPSIGSDLGGWCQVAAAARPSSRSVDQRSFGRAACDSQESHDIPVVSAAVALRRCCSGPTRPRAAAERQARTALLAAAVASTRGLRTPRKIHRALPDVEIPDSRLRRAMPRAEARRMPD